MLTHHTGTSEPSQMQIWLGHLCSNQGSWQKTNVNILGFSLISALPLPYPAPEGEALTVLGWDSTTNYGQDKLPHPTKSEKFQSSCKLRIKLKFKTSFGSFKEVACSLSHPGLLGLQEMPGR